MCSIFKYRSCVGRNFDYEQSFNEELRIIDRDEFYNDYKIIGMCAGIEKDYPLLYDAMNEHGVVMGGLAFEGNAQYNKIIKGKCNVPSYDFILNTLGLFKSVSQIKEYIECVNITDKAYSDSISPSPLHWFVADKNESIIIEQTKEGVSWYAGDVMTNNPPFPLQKECYESCKKLIGEHLHESYEFQDEWKTRGLETYHLNGSYTSDGRFERLSFLKSKLESYDTNFNPIPQAFHLLSSVEQIYGATPVRNNFEHTIYSIVYDMKNLKIYRRTYDSVNTIVNSEWSD